MSTPACPDTGVLELLATKQSKARDLLAVSIDEQLRAGYFHTLREICQQPATWLDTARRMVAVRAAVLQAISGVQALALTGSGSSLYAGECVRFVLQNEMAVPAEAISAGALVTHSRFALAPSRPAAVVSLARSGDSPESAGALAWMIESEPEIRHLILTCNEQGNLAQRFRQDPRANVIALEARTNDRSLVMTSSFTNLVLAARYLGLTESSERYGKLCADLSAACCTLIESHFDTLARVAQSGFDRAVFLGSGDRVGAARECALKMLEMTAGRVGTMCETYLGLRHGPMSYVHENTLIVCFLSSEPVLRAYEVDLIRELNTKQLGLSKVIAGEGVPTDLASAKDVVLECPGMAAIGDENVPVLDVVIGQILAFFRCLHDGLRPDSPSDGGVINRVVQSFPLYGSATGESR